MRTTRLRILAPVLAAGLLMAAAPAAVSGQATPPPLPTSYDEWRYGPRDGLSSSSIVSMAQSQDGTLWLATSSGVVRFDGSSFATFLWPPAGVTSGDAPQVVTAAPDGGIWVASTTHVITRLAEGQLVSTLPPQDGEPEWVRAMAVDRRQRVWTLSTRRVARYDGTAWKQFAFGPVAFGEAAAMLVDESGTVWIQATGGLFIAGEEAVRPVTEAPPASIGAPLALAAGEPGHLLIAGVSGVAVRDTSGRYRAFPSAAPAERVLAVAPGAPGQVWAVTTSTIRLYALPAGTGGPAVVAEFPHDTNGPAARTQLVRTDSGAVFLSNTTGGLRSFVQRRFALYGRREGLAIPAVQNLMEDRAGVVMVDGCTQLVRLSEGRITPVRPADAVPRNTCVRALLSDRAANTWLGFDNAMSRRTPGGTVTHWSADNLGQLGAIGPFFEDRDRHLWIGTGVGTVLRVDSLQPQLEPPLTGLPSARVWSFAQTADGSVWVGQVGALTRVSSGSAATLDGRHGVPPGAVRVLRVAPSGALWLGTYGGGLARYRDGTFAPVTSAHGLFDNWLSALVTDRAGRVWLLGNRGVFVTTWDQLESAADGQRATIDGVLFGPEDGMPEGNSGHSAALLLQDGRLAFATVEGLAVIDAPRFPFNTAAITPAITRVAGAGVRVATDGTVVVPPAGRLVIGFAAPGFASRAPVLFRYRLAGRDTRWVGTGPGREVRYEALPPGQYVFHAAARNEDGVWSATPAVVRILVPSRWWQTWWGRLLVGIILAAAVAALVGWLLHVVHGRTRVLEHEIEERKRAEALAQRHQRELAHASRLATAGELTASLAHEIGQPLMAILANAEAARRLVRDEPPGSPLVSVLDEISREGRRASNVVRQLRAFLGRDQPDVKLLDLNETIRGCLTLVSTEVAAAMVALTVDLDPRPAPVLGERVPLQQVVLNLVMNAVDAVAATRTGSRRVTLRTRVRGRSMVRLLVADSGPGIPPASRAWVFEPFHSTKLGGMGLGLSICRSIVLAHGGRIGVRSCRGGGAVFVVSLPLTEQRL